MLDNKIEINKIFIQILKGSVLSFIISLILLFIYAILLTFTNISETTMVPVVITVAGISILIGSSVSSLKIKKQGMINGTIVGLIYMLSIYLISSISYADFNLDLQSIVMIVIGTIAGMIGGIIGVNL